MQVNGVQRQNRPPVPLATLEMQKRVTRQLRIPGEAIMKLAEELYQAGFISYPRTETDRFSADYDLKVPPAPYPHPNRPAISHRCRCGLLCPEPSAGQALGNTL